MSISIFFHFFNPFVVICIENISIMVLTWSQYKNVSKEELIQELTDKNSSFVNNINAKLINLSEKFNKFR